MASRSVGVIGLGIMGSALAASLMRGRYRVVGYDVLETRRRAHRRAGGHVARDCADVGRQADVAICSLPSALALQQAAAGLAESARPGLIVVETSTLPIADKEAARAVLHARGATMLDCPLSGTGSQARVKDLVVYASGDRRAYRRVGPVLDAFARARFHVGEFGSGSKMKFVANLLVAVHNVAAAEALVLAMKAGLDPRSVFEVISAGAGTSRMLQVRGPMMVKGRYTPALMKLGVWQKDMAIIADFARGVGAQTPLFSTTAPLYTAAVASRRADEDTGAVCAILEDMAGIRRPGTFEVHSTKGKGSSKSEVGK
jgi:3-hydroxyisobutyrate dehydrogenase-like beta-hydroxyacid dehydrogenase